MLLKNRIALLKLEEEKANKKIKETMKKTKDILNVKNSKEQELYRKLNRKEIL